MQVEAMWDGCGGGRARMEVMEATYLGTLSVHLVGILCTLPFLFRVGRRK